MSGDIPKDVLAMWREHSEFAKEWNRQGLSGARLKLYSQGCVHLGDVVLEIPGDAVSCNLNSVKLHDCDYHNEAVTRLPMSSDGVNVVEAWAASRKIKYGKKNCMNCKYSRRATRISAKASKNLTISDVTIVTTTFKRPEALVRLVASISRLYPSIRVVVVDTEDTQDERLLANISAGRNKAVNSVKTKLVLLVDDDFEFTESTRIEHWLDVLNHDSANGNELAGVSGTMVEKDRSYSWCHTISVFRGRMNIRPSSEEWQATPSGVVYRPCDMTINFFLARTEVLRETKWDEDLSLEEHRDWFLRIWNLRKWRWAWVPSVTCLHHRDRNPEYTKFRNRSFLHVAQKKHGLKFDKPILNGMLKMHPLGMSAHLLGKPHPPTAVIIGVGHSNTTITAKQFEMLGFNLNDADDEFAESVAVRELNDLALDTWRLNVVRAKALLKGWRRPWAVKDPRFAKGALPMWMQVFVEYAPILFWIDKPLEVVAKSHEKRGENYSNINWMHRNCVAYYDSWPWAKYHIRTGQIADACAAFDFDRVNTVKQG